MASLATENAKNKTDCAEKNAQEMIDDAKAKAASMLLSAKTECERMAAIASDLKVRITDLLTTAAQNYNTVRSQAKGLRENLEKQVVASEEMLFAQRAALEVLPAFEDDSIFNVNLDAVIEPVTEGIDAVAVLKAFGLDENRTVAKEEISEAEDYSGMASTQKTQPITVSADFENEINITKEITAVENEAITEKENGFEDFSSIDLPESVNDCDVNKVGNTIMDELNVTVEQEENYTAQSINEDAEALKADIDAGVAQFTDSVAAVVLENSVIPEETEAEQKEEQTAAAIEIPPVDIDDFDDFDDFESIDIGEATQDKAAEMVNENTETVKEAIEAVEEKAEQAAKENAEAAKEAEEALQETVQNAQVQLNESQKKLDEEAEKAALIDIDDDFSDIADSLFEKIADAMGEKQSAVKSIGAKVTLAEDKASEKEEADDFALVDDTLSEPKVLSDETAQAEKSLEQETAGFNIDFSAFEDVPAARPVADSNNSKSKKRSKKKKK